MQRTSIVSTAYFGFRFGGVFPAFHFRDRDEAIQLRLELVNSLQGFIEEFHGRDLPPLNERGELRKRTKR
jgi:hypothetical protein